MILTTITPVKYPIHTGNRQIFVGTGNGPGTYNSTTGDVLSVAFVPFFIDAVLGPSISVSGNYIVVPKPIAVGNGQGWTLFWYNFSTTGTPAWTVPTTVATTEQVQLTVIGGA